MFRCILVLLSLILSLSMAHAFEGHGPGHPRFPLQSRVFSVIHRYWECNELLLSHGRPGGAAPDEAYHASFAGFARESAELGAAAAASLGSAQDEIRLLSEIYRSLHPAVRPSPYPALRYLRAEASRTAPARLTRGAFDTYFPGYGYVEPGFAYRKGREVSREDKGSTWVTEDRTIKASANVELEISFSLVPHFRALEAAGTIRNLKVGEPFARTSRAGVKITFQASQDLVIKTHRRFAVSKIWFELWRAKGDPWWTTGPWEVCGKTYEIVDEPTGDTQVSDVQ